MNSPPKLPSEHQNILKAIEAYFIKGPELEFMIDLIKKSIVFLGILCVAAGLNQAVERLSETTASVIYIDGLWLVENLLFTADILGFSCYIIVSTLKATLQVFQDAELSSIEVPILRRSRE